MCTLCIAVCGCRRGAGDGGAGKPGTVKQWVTMGTYAGVTVPVGDEALLDGYAAAAKAVVDDFDLKMSTWKPDSEISRLNALAGEGSMGLSKITWDGLKMAVTYSLLTEGRFDPTVGPLLPLWGLRGDVKPAAPPSQAQIDDALKTIGFKKIGLFMGGRATIRQKGVKVDLGGIAKGYAVDEAMDAMKELGATSVMMDVGGNIKCSGEARPGKAWRIGVRNPFNRDAILGSFELASGFAVATSGNYERFVEIQGKRYAHILDPRTGRPVQGVAGVTVVAPTAARADALSTAFFVAGLDEAPEMLSKFPGCAVLIIPDEKPVRLVMNEAFEKIYTPPSGSGVRCERLGQ